MDIYMSNWKMNIHGWNPLPFLIFVDLRLYVELLI